MNDCIFGERCALRLGTAVMRTLAANISGLNLSSLDHDSSKASWPSSASNRSLSDCCSGERDMSGGVDKME